MKRTQAIRIRFYNVVTHTIAKNIDYRYRYESKSVISVPTINSLGYCVGNDIIKTDPDRLRPLQELPPPTTVKSLRRVLGMFAYYAK